LLLSTRKDCYTAQLTINGVAAGDDRTYYFMAENERGQLRAAVRLAVTDPISMGAVIGIAVSCLVLAVVFLLGLVYSRRTRSCCFRDRGHFRPEDIVRIERRKEEGAGGSEGGSSGSEGRPVHRLESPLNPSARPDIGNYIYGHHDIPILSKHIETERLVMLFMYHVPLICMAPEVLRVNSCSALGEK